MNESETLPNIVDRYPSKIIPWRAGIMTKPKDFTKEDYLRISQEKTAIFVHKHFGDIIKELFVNLRKDADQRKHCHREVRFEVPDPFDVNKAEETLRLYFRGLGFEVIAEPRKEDTNIITLTLT